MTDNIDWTKPIEAYHEDGRVVKVDYSGRSGSGAYNISPELPGYVFSFKSDGTHLCSGWRIRNRKSDKPICVDTLRKVLEVLPEPDHRTSDRWRIEAVEDCRAAIQALLPKDRAETLVEEWSGVRLIGWLSYCVVDFARWLEANGHLKDER